MEPYPHRNDALPVLSPGPPGVWRRCPGPHLLFEIAPFLLVYKHQVEVIAHRELLVDVPHGGGELVASQEEPDWDGLSYKDQAGIRARDKVTTLPYTKSLTRGGDAT